MPQECFNSPYGHTHFPVYAENIGFTPGETYNVQESTSESVKMLSATAKEVGAWLIGGVSCYSSYIQAPALNVAFRIDSRTRCKGRQSVQYMHCLQPKGCSTIYLFLNLTEHKCINRRIGGYASKGSFVRHRHSWKNQVQGGNLKTLVA